jgi:SH3-like domain-containing protein
MVVRIAAGVWLAVSLTVGLGQAAARADDLRYVSGSYVHLRVGPGLDQASQGLMPRGTVVKLVQVQPSWCQVAVGAVQGWVSRQYLVVSTDGLCGTEPIAHGWIGGDRVNVRAGPGLNCRVRTRVNTGEPVDILASASGWYLLRFSTALEGWVASWLVKVPEPLRNLPPPAAPPAAQAGSTVVDSAMRLLGVRYVYSGESPSEGFDCSGFVHYVLEQHGCSLPHSAEDQFQFGFPVAAGSLMPGDVVFFCNTYKPGISHSGIYVGNGQFIHASSAAGGVVVTPLAKEYYAKRFVGARRMR